MRYNHRQKTNYLKFKIQRHEYKLTELAFKSLCHVTANNTMLQTKL